MFKLNCLLLVAPEEFVLTGNSEGGLLCMLSVLKVCAVILNSMFAAIR